MKLKFTLIKIDNGKIHITHSLACSSDKTSNLEIMNPGVFLENEQVFLKWKISFLSDSQNAFLFEQIKTNCNFFGEKGFVDSGSGFDLMNKL